MALSSAFLDTGPYFPELSPARRLHSMAFMVFYLMALVGHFTYDAFDDSRYC